MENADIIGNGHFGIVIKEKMNNDKIIAKKTINIKKFNDKIGKTVEEIIKKIKNRIQIMNKINNNKSCNITKYYDDIIDKDSKLSFKMELCDCNLRKYLDKNCPKKGKGLDIEQIYDILVQLNNAFNILEIYKIVHGNIKLENILVKLTKKKSIFKLSGFEIIPEFVNITKPFEPDIFIYLPPEILVNNNTFEIDQKTDSWSLGLIIYYLCFKEFPYKGKTCKAVLEQIENNKRKKTYNAELNNLIDGLLNINKEERLNWDKYLNHHFFTWGKDYELKESLGGESCYTINKVREYLTNSEKVLKIINKEEIRTQYLTEGENIEESKIEEFVKLLIEQTKIMKILENNNNNKNTVKFFKYFDSKTEFAVVMEKCDTDLSHIFIKRENNYSLEEIKELLNQLNNTFKIMSKNEIIHGDLKLENILVNNKKNKLYKLTDYGVSQKFLNMNKNLMGWGGSPQYSAPEVLSGNDYNSSCDLWSLGIILYTLYKRKNPYDGDTDEEVLDDIKTKGQLHLHQISDDPNFDHLIRRLLTFDPKDRITWEEYFEHPFLKGGTCWKYFEERQSLGKGQYYKVYKAKSKITGEYKAIKVIDLNQIRTLFEKKYFHSCTKEDMKGYIDDFIEEVNFSELRRGANKENNYTVIYEQYFQTDDEFCIAYEFCDGDLLQLKETKGKFTSKEIYQIFKQLNNTFKIIQECKQNVRDLRLEEILFIKNKKGNGYIYKILNFENDKKVVKLFNASGSKKGDKYKAPEILEILSNPKKSINSENLNSLYQKAYLWNIGIIIYFLYYGHLPYKGERPKEILENIKKDKQAILEGKEENDLNDLLKKLLTEDKDKRIDWNDYFNHRFFSEE